MNKEEFIKELKNISINIDEDKLKKLDIYYKLLVEYNNKFNLTRIIDEEDVYLKHFYDSLTINKVIDLKNINSLCDIGTGAGFPGLVIAIMYPNINVTLVDSLNKRIMFLEEVIKKLELKNVVALHASIEVYAKLDREKFDIVTSRAVAKINILLEMSVNMLKINGRFVALKSNVNEELENSTNAIKILKCKISNIVKFRLPKEMSNRTIIVIEKCFTTPIIYPRKFDKIKKNPL